MNKKIAVAFGIIGVIFLIGSFVLEGENIYSGILILSISVAFFKQCTDIENKEKYIYENSEAEHKILYDEMMIIKSEYDIAKKESKLNKVVKIVGCVIATILIIVMFYMSYKNPNGVLYNDVDVVDIIFIMIFIVIMLFFVYLILSAPTFNPTTAFNEIETKMYNLCIKSDNDEKALEELKKYRALIEKRRLLTKKFKKIRSSQM